MSEQNKEPKPTGKKTSENHKRFAGHNQSELKGCVLSITSTANQYNELKQRLQTMGGSKYSPNVGRSIENMIILKRIDFKANKPKESDWTTVTVGSDGKEVRKEDNELKEELLDMYKEEVSVKAKEYCAYNQDMKKMYAVTWGQLDDSIQEKIKSSASYETVNNDRDLIGLLTILRDLCYQGNQTKVHGVTNLIRAHRKLITFKQRGSEPAQYVKQMVENFEVYKSLGGTIVCRGTYEHYMTKQTTKITYDSFITMSDKEQNVIINAIEQEFLASLIVEGSDDDTSTLRQNLGDQFNLGVDQYPTTTSRALDMLIHFKGSKKSSQRKTTNQTTNRSRGAPIKAEEKKREGQDATAFVNKGTEKNMTGKQLLLNAVEANEDFGQPEDFSTDYNLFIQVGVENQQGNEEELPGLVPRSEIYTSSDDESTVTPKKFIGMYQWSDSDDDWLDEEDDTEMITSGDHSWSIFGHKSEMRVHTHTHHTNTKGKLSNHEDDDGQDTTLPQPHPFEITPGEYTGKSMLIKALDLSLTPSQKHDQDKRESYYYKQPCEYLLAQMTGTNQDGAVDKNWLLLDSESSCNLIANKDMLNNIRKAPDGRYMSVYCNSGVAETNMIGDLPGFGEVWYYPDGIANVLSLALVSDQYPISMDTRIDNAFHVHKPDGSTRRFSRSTCNLYYCDMASLEARSLAITTTEGKKQLYSDLDVRRAEKARKLQEQIGFPTTQSMKRMIDNNIIKNCPVSKRDLDIADAIYGPHTAIIKGTNVRGRVSHVHEQIKSLPATILENYGQITLCIDIFTVNGINFLHTISRHIRFRTTCAINDMRKDTLLSCIQAVIGNYRSRGFTVVQIFADNQFACLQDSLAISTPPVQLHCVPAGAHEPTVERSIRTVKESMRCHFDTLPCHRIPKRCLAELAYAVTFWLNCRTVGVSKTMSAREIITGIPFDASSIKFQFFEAIMARNEHNNNTMAPRAVEALYLRPTGNLSGGFYAFDLATGRRIHRLRATPIPTSNLMMQRIEQLAAAQHMPLGLLFDNVDNPLPANIPDSDSYSYCPSLDTDDDDSLEGVIDEATALQDRPDTPDVQSDDREDEADTTAPDRLAPTESNEPHTDELDDDISDNNPPGQNADNENTNSDAEGNNDADHPTESMNVNDDSNDIEPRSVNDDTESDSTLPRLRPRVQRTHNKYTAEDGYNSQTHARSFFTAGFTNAIHHLGLREHAVMLVAKAIHTYNNFDASQVTKQYGVKQGIKKFGEKGVDAVLKELQQFHDRGVAEVMSPKEMSPEMRQQALPYLMFLKRKRCGKIKGRGCADGRKQREFISKEDATSPTVSLYALMISCMIDAIEERDVATADIPGAFLQTDMPDGEDVFIRMDGTMAELLCRIDPKLYRPHMIDRNGKKIIYAKAKKAIYGTLRAALLFWENLSGKLKEWGFTANPYDACTMNKIIDGKQCTIVWHVDDLKISHVNPDVVSGILDKLDEEYGRISPLTRTRGKVHEYVGMTIDYTTKGKVKFSMFDYLEDLLRSLPDELRGESISPASDHLFKVNAEADKLDARKAESFHHFVAKLLFMAKRSRPDIQTAVAFLCTRVKNPDVDDWKKLKRCMSYLSMTPFLPLELGWDGTGNVYWHVDAAFAVHEDMRSHTGGYMTMGSGAIIGISTKQKINTKSSTEAEVVGVDDNMNFICWVRHFMQGQQQYMTDNIKDASGGAMIGTNHIIYQDNESAMKLEKNGQASSTKRTKHINVRYFFITDRVKRGEVTVEYCPTKEIVADYFTKPLQGSQFRKFRNTILGIDEAKYQCYRHEYYNKKASRYN